MRIPAAVLLVALTSCAFAQTHPRDKDIHDPDTLAWWHTTEALSNDSMEGRDTGTAAYQRAADMVAARFKAAGLQPAGENGTYFQTVLMHQLDVVGDATNFTYNAPSAAPVSLAFLKEIDITASPTLPAELTAAITFRGYCGKDAMADISGKIVVCFNARHEGLPAAADRMAAARAGNAAGLISIDDMSFTLEPARWPSAYSRSVTLRMGDAPRRGGSGFVTMRLGDAGFTRLVGAKAADILKSGKAHQPLASFDLPGSFTIHTKIAEKDISSPNILAILPGSDPALKSEYVVAGAHLDGYGYGEPVRGDNLYNGTLDDAAYVALLIQMADDIKAGKLPKPKRSLLLCAFTGEEKGLLGSRWFVAHMTVPQAQIVADVNLDQLRPLFPLNILTVEAQAESTLGQTAKDVATPMHIETRPDMEPERGLIRRADEFPFLELGIPAIGFVFGYDPGTESERRYREWYDVRYHRPQDDLTQPMDFDAALKFDTFFYSIVESIANTPAKPSMLATSHFKK